MSNPETSIIIRTFNEERYLPGLLDGIARQQYRDFEIVNVDSGSYDSTTEIARQHHSRILNIESRDFTFGYSLNVGIEAALGKYMVIVSAHTDPFDSQWLERLVAPLRDEKTAMVYGRQYGVASSKYGEIRDLERTFGPRKKVLKPPQYFANNANSAISRKLWELHPFDEDLTGQEDIEWAKHWMDNGYDVVYEPDAGIFHIHHETWRQVRHRYYREALATRNIGVWNRKHAVSLAVKEAAHLTTDTAEALKRGQLFDKYGEIVRFRYNKCVGTVTGILEGRDVQSPSMRESLFFDRKCSGVVIHGRGQASLREIDVPSVKPSEVLIKVAYTGVTNADIGLLEEDISFFGGESPRYPVIPGSDLSGWVAKTGANVKHLKEGDTVAVQSSQGCGSCDLCRESTPELCISAPGSDRRGAYSEFVAVPGMYVHRLPDSVEMKKAVMCEALATIVKAFKKLEAFLGTLSNLPKFAVVGAGPIGHMCANMLSMREYPVTVYDDNPKRLSYFEGTSVAASSDKSELSGHDFLIEATGDPGTFQHMLNVSKPGAALLLLGLPYSQRQFSIEGGNTFDKTIIWSAGATTADFEEAAITLPHLQMDALTEFVLPMSEFKDAWDNYRKGEHLKVLLKVT